MPTINLNRKLLEQKTGKIQEKKLKERISMLGTPIENITKDEIILEIFPNRPDLLSQQGFTRALLSFLGKKVGLKEYTAKKSNYKLMIESEVNKVRPFTSCAVVKNLKFDNETIKEIIQIQEKLHITYGRNRKKIAIGIYPLEKIKFPITYTAKKPNEIKFKPLDFQRELTGSQILSQHPAGREYAHLLKDKGLFPIFIDCNNQILSMPPIINSDLTGKVTATTKEIFIECSGFDQSVLNKCLNMIVTSLADIGGEIYLVELNYGTKKITTPALSPDKMKVALNYINKMLGLNLKEVEIKKFLEKMGYSYKNKTVLIPCYRTDIISQIDLVEDIAIAYGYENFKPEIPNISTIAEESKFEIFKNKIANILIGLNLIETNTYSLTNAEIQNKKSNCNFNLVELSNSINKEYIMLRFWIIPSLLQVLAENKHNEYPQNLFEINAVFKNSREAETQTKEETNLSIILHHKKADFTEIKQILDCLFNALSLRYAIKETTHPTFIPGRVGNIIVNNKEAGIIGEIHPSTLQNFDLEFPASALEINIQDIFKLI